MFIELLTTARLRLEPLRVDDAEEMFDMLADPALYVFTGGEPPTLDELRVRYQWQVGGRSPDGTEEWLNWIVRISTPTGRRSGSCRPQLSEIRPTSRGSSASRGKVAATPREAAQAMIDWLRLRGVETITAHIHADHAASAAVAARLGLAPTDEIEDGEVVWR